MDKEKMNDGICVRVEQLDEQQLRDFEAMKSAVKLNGPELMPTFYYHRHHAENTYDSMKEFESAFREYDRLTGGSGRDVKQYYQEEFAAAERAKRREWRIRRPSQFLVAGMTRLV